MFASRRSFSRLCLVSGRCEMFCQCPIISTPDLSVKVLFYFGTSKFSRVYNEGTQIIIKMLKCIFFSFAAFAIAIAIQ